MQRQVEIYFPTMWERVAYVLKNAGFVDEKGEIKFSDAEVEAGIKRTVLSKLKTRKNGTGKLSEHNLTKIQRTFHVKMTWLTTGKGPVYEENITSVPKPEPLGQSVDHRIKQLEGELETTKQLAQTRAELILVHLEKIKSLKDDLAAARAKKSSE